MTCAEILRQGEEMLARCGIEENRIDAWFLFSRCFGMDRGAYLMRMREEAPEAPAEAFRAMIRRRGQRIPLQQLLGSQEFMGLEFSVNSHVLIPRQDTETLTESVLEEIKNTMRPEQPLRILDLCTGSGCIAISLACYLKKAGYGKLEMVLSDISREALEVADENICRLGCEDVCRTVHSDLFEALEGRKFDRIVSNPPYIPTGVIGELEPEVREHEPRLALDGSGDGLEFYRRIGKEAPGYLEEGGILWLEIGYDQAQAVGQILEQSGFAQTEVIKDLTGKDRVIRTSGPAGMK